MVDSVIVTALNARGVIIGDFELPVKITIEELSREIIEFLKAKDCDRYEYLSEIQIEYNGRVLRKSETLYENEVWDGSILKFIF